MKRRVLLYLLSFIVTAFSLSAQQLTLTSTINLFGVDGKNYFRPYDMFQDGQNNLYVVNGEGRLFGAGSIVKLDAQANVGKVWRFSSQTDSLQFPQTVAVDSKGRVYTNEFHKLGIVQLDSNGFFIQRLGNMMRGSLTADGKGNIYCMGLNKVYKKALLSEVFEPLDVLDTLADPYYAGIAVDKDGNMYLSGSSYERGRVGKLSKSGKFQREWKFVEGHRGRFGSITTDLKGNVYVSDSSSVWKFDSTGNTLAHWQIGWHAFVKVDANYRVYIGNTHEQRIDIYSQELGPLANEEVALPTAAIALYPNPSTGIFTLRGIADRVKVYDRDGKLVRESLTNNNQIDLSDQQAGIYFAELETKGKVQRVKLQLTGSR